MGLLAFGCAIILMLTTNNNADLVKVVAKGDGLTQRSPVPIKSAISHKPVSPSQNQPVTVSADSIEHIDNSKPKLIPGLFRGDWGPTPVYAKNDRVNFERGAYLSLVDNNQNQPPSTSQGYWQLVKKFKALHEENCFAPAPGLDMGECDFTAMGSIKDLNLQGANLIKARLNGELGAADLTGANLSGAAVLGTLVISSDTIMTNANLSYLQSDGNNPVIAEHANLAYTNFTQANLYGAKLSHADLTSAHMPEAVLTGSQLISTNFADANLTKVDLAYANLTDSSLIHAAMPQANLEQADLHGADFSQANLQQANLAGTQIAGVNFSGTDLHGVNLSAAQGADSTIIDNQTNFTGAICPDGVTVDGTQVTTCVGHGF
jgi:uncharacterized protein YjbI with pentapeptide repeats